MWQLMAHVDHCQGSLVGKSVVLEFVGYQPEAEDVCLPVDGPLCIGVEHLRRSVPKFGLAVAPDERILMKLFSGEASLHHPSHIHQAVLPLGARLHDVVRLQVQEG